MTKIKLIELFISELTGEEYSIVCWYGLNFGRVELKKSRTLKPKSFFRPVFEHNGNKYVMITEHDRAKYIIEEVKRGE